MNALVQRHATMFAIIAAWQCAGVVAMRLYAAESLAALIPAGMLTAFWFSGTKLCTGWWLMPTAVVAAMVGTYVGVRLSL